MGATFPIHLTSLWLLVGLSNVLLVQLDGFILKPAGTPQPVSSPEILPPFSLNYGQLPPSLTQLYNELWNKLEIEEDPESYWYLINCVAGLEMDLLKQ